MAPVSSQALIHLESVHYRWPGAGAFGLDVPRFEVARGERLLLIGPSGSGKSTLLALLAGIVAPHEGRISILGQDLAYMKASMRDRFRAEHMGVIFQMFNLLPYGSAIDNVVLPLSFAPKRRARVGDGLAQTVEASRLLGRLGLREDAVSRPRAADLSVGQQQRVAAARALIGAPELIIADEPTSALDTDARDQFLDLVLGELAAAGSTLVMVSHDPSLGSRFDRVMRLSDLILQAKSGKAEAAP
ncbi:MAG: ABC transporter ATP-binding protein [Proteobacteria bacterium]|nr:ABC transporter ATP-binding protein [Pseudomonadota bacterium]